MKFRRANDGRIHLKDKNGNDVSFRFPVDVNEALSSVDENGEKRYFLTRDSVLTIGEEIFEHKVRKEIKNRVILDKANKGKIQTTTGKKIGKEHLIAEEDVEDIIEDIPEDTLDKAFVSPDPQGVDNLDGQDDKALDDMGFEDPADNSLDDLVEKPEEPETISRRGRKPASEKKE